MFKAEVAAAATVGKDYVLGESNSVAGGGAATVSPLFGAAIWTLDHTVRAASIGIKRIYYHHGTIGKCYYCWWGRYVMGSPYYGAYAATAFMAGGSSIIPLDSGTSNYGGYAVFDHNGGALKVLLINSDYYGGTGARGSTTFVLSGLQNGGIKAKRLTAQSSNSRVDQGSNPTFGGQEFANVTCTVLGAEVLESSNVVGGRASFAVGASEALLVYL